MMLWNEMSLLRCGWSGARRRIVASNVRQVSYVNSISEVVKNHKTVLGPRAIVVSSLEEAHKNAAGKVWFELQKVGIQSTFLNLKSRFPSIESIQDGVNLLKRTGSTSIVTIGNSTITDYGKALQMVADGHQSVTALLQDPTATTTRPSIPRLGHVSVATTPSICHFLASSQIIHSEEDILLEIPCFQPSVICRDPQFTSLSEAYFHPVLAKSLLLVNLLDDLIACHLCLNGNDEVKSLINRLSNSNSLRHILEKAIASETNVNSSDFSDALSAVALFRDEIQKNLPLSLAQVPEAYPAPLQMVAMLMQTNVTLKLTLPHCFHVITAAGSLLHHHSPAQRRRYVSASDKKLLNAIDSALSFLHSSEGLSIPADKISTMIEDSMKLIEETVNSKPKLFAAPKLPQRSTQTSKEESLTAAGNLEKVSIFLDFLSEKNESNSILFSEKKLLLRSDILLDMMEAMLEADLQ
jgi:hypothetical protein